MQMNLLTAKFPFAFVLYAFDLKRLSQKMSGDFFRLFVDSLKFFSLPLSVCSPIYIDYYKWVRKSNISGLAYFSFLFVYLLGELSNFRYQIPLKAKRNLFDSHIQMRKTKQNENPNKNVKSEEPKF